MMTLVAGQNEYEFAYECDNCFTKHDAPAEVCQKCGWGRWQVAGQPHEADCPDPGEKRGGHVTCPEVPDPVLEERAAVVRFLRERRCAEDTLVGLAVRGALQVVAHEIELGAHVEVERPCSDRRATHCLRCGTCICLEDDPGSSASCPLHGIGRRHTRAFDEAAR